MALPDALNPPRSTGCDAAGLRSLDVSRNQLQSLPSGLALATALSRLNIACNRGVHLTCADVEHLLARLPNLRTLEDWDTQTPEDVREYAARVLQLRAD